MKETFLENLLSQGLMVLVGLMLIVRTRKSIDVDNHGKILMLCLKIVTILIGALFCYSVFHGFSAGYLP